MTPEALCDGLGTVQSFSEDLLVRDASLSLATGALHVITDEGRLVYSNLDLSHFTQVGEALGFDIHTPWQDLSAAARKVRDPDPLATHDEKALAAAIAALVVEAEAAARARRIVDPGKLRVVRGRSCARHPSSA